MSTDSFTKFAEMEVMQPYSSEHVTQQLLDLGVEPGGVLLVHCAFSKIRPILGGPLGLIDALQAVLGLTGTLVMPSMSYDDYHPFDPKRTPCLEVGVVADTFWRLKGVLRSVSPHAFAARGPEAPTITSLHPIDVPHGLHSPVGRVYELDGQVLLLGVGHDANTTIHLAENMAGVRYRLKTFVHLFVDGKLQRMDFSEVNHCCRNFAFLDSWLAAKTLQKQGMIGHSVARLARSRDIVNVALDHLRSDETIFLHPLGGDEECDKARASMSICGDEHNE